MTVKTGTAWAGAFVTLDATGALEAGTPSGVLYVDGVADAATVTITGSNPYKWSVTLPSLTAGQRVDMYITATISTIATAGFVASEQADTALVSEVKAETALIVADTGTDGVVLKAAGLATDAVNEIVDQVWNELVNDHTATGSFGQMAGGRQATFVPTQHIKYGEEAKVIVMAIAHHGVGPFTDNLVFSGGFQNSVCGFYTDTGTLVVTTNVVKLADGIYTATFSASQTQFNTAMLFLMSVTASYRIYYLRLSTIVAPANEYDTDIAAILADTNELQTDLVNGGRLDLLIDAIKAKTDTITTPPTAASVADAVWDEAIADHTTATTFGGKNQKVVPSETINDYKADVSGLALDGEYDADFTQVVELLYSIMGGEGWTDETLVSIQSAIEALDTNSVLLEAIDGTYTLKDVIYIMASLLGGKLTRVEDTLTFRDLSDTTNVVVAETDEHKQRIDMTYTV
jgi:hypothetical protein